MRSLAERTWNDNPTDSTRSRIRYAARLSSNRSRNDLGPIADTELAPGEGISFTATGGGVGIVWCGVSGYEAVNAMPAISGLTQANQSKLPASAQGTIRFLTFTAS